MKWEVHYCYPSMFSNKSWATGSRRFESEAELVMWITVHVPVLITGIEDLTIPLTERSHANNL